MILCTCCRRFSFSSSSSSESASASSILACSSFWTWAELGISGLRGTWADATNRSARKHLERCKDLLNEVFYVPCILSSFCNTEFPFPEARKDVAGRTGSLGHLAAWEDEAPVKDTVVIISAALMHCVCVWSVKRKMTYLRGFRLTDSQSFSEISIHSIIGFPFPLRRLDPVGDDLRGKKNNKHLIVLRKFASNRANSYGGALSPFSSPCSPLPQTCTHWCSPCPWWSFSGSSRPEMTASPSFP